MKILSAFFHAGVAIAVAAAPAAERARAIDLIARTNYHPGAVAALDKLMRKPAPPKPAS